MLLFDSSIMLKDRVGIAFSGVPNRGWIFEVPVVKKLVSLMPLEIAVKFRKCFLEDGLKSPEAEELRIFFRKHSTIFRTVEQSPSSSETFEYLYRERPTEGEIDEYFPNGKAAIGIYQRLGALKIELPSIIREEIRRISLPKGEKFIVVNMGSGPGHDMIGVLAENPDLVERVHVINVEPDAPMLEVGRKKVESLGLSESFSFIAETCQDAGLKLGGAHMILAIGIFCPMPKRVCVKVLKNLAPFIPFGGLIVFNTIQVRMVEEDPMTDFIMRLAGWRMGYKDDSEPFEIAKMSGWEPFYRFFDQPLHYNCMVAAHLKWSLNGLLKKAGYQLNEILKRFRR